MTQTKPTTPPTSGKTKTAPRRVAEFRIHNGARTLFIENHPAPEVLTDLSSDGEIAEGTLFRLRSVALGWKGPETFDYAALDARVNALLQVRPDARFLIEVIVDAPEWWRVANPSECAAYVLPPAANALHETPPASWASQPWKLSAGQALTNLIRHVQKAEWRTRCLGYQIAAGEAGEWRHSHPERMPDVGPRMTEQFKRFALDKYRRNEGVLRKEWFDARAEFNKIACPNERDRKKADMGAFRNPARARRLFDYFEAFFAAQNDAALHFCQTVKKATDGDALVGLTYAALPGHDLPAEAGHAYPETVLDSELVDFFIAPDAPRSLPAASLNLRGKFLFRKPEPAKKEKRKDKTDDEPPKTELAIVVDYAASLYVRPEDNWLNKTLVTEQLKELDRAGVAYDVYLFSDLFHPKLPNYKVWIFANNFYLSEAERRRLDARIKRSDQTAIFLWGVGLVGEEGVSPIYAQRAYGQKVRLEPSAANLRARIADTNDAFILGQVLNRHFGTEYAAAPTITVTDKTITRLGANSANKTNFSVLRLPHWTSVLCAAAPIPAALIENILKFEPQRTQRDTEDAQKGKRKHK